MPIPQRLLISLSLFLLAGLLPAAPPPEPPPIDAAGYLLIDMDSGRVLAESQADQRLEPASLTKIMTAYVVFNELREGTLKLDDTALVSKKAWKTPGSRMFIEVGRQVSIDDLLRGMVIQSGNDASVALAEHIAGSEETFAGLMNQHAQRLGMDNTNFVNATGLPATEHYTTPRDIVRVTSAMIREFPDYYRLYSERSFTFNDIKQYNRNKLLWRDDSVDGVKTGHTEAAGYCLVATAKRQNMRLISVVMGTASEDARAKESQALLNFGFRFFETHRLYAAGEALLKTRVWKGEPQEAPVGLAEDLYVTIPRRQYKNLEAKTVLDQRLQAPIARAQPIGRIVLTLEGETVEERPLISLADVPLGGLFTQGMDSLLLMLE